MQEYGDIFDAKHYAVVLEPLERAETLPPWCYTSAAFYEREVERVFKRKWVCVARVERAPNPGDYVATDVAGVPIFLLRDDDGELRAFANTCRHRGMQLVDGSGRCERLVRCPYHGWSYRFDGSLAGAPEMGNTPGFDIAEFGLLPLRLKTAAGFVFINLDDNAPSLDQYLGGFESLLAPYALNDMVCVRSRAYKVACNWKLFIEIFMEYYHLKAVHPDTLHTVNYDIPDPPDEVEGEFVSQFGTHQGTSAVLEDSGGGRFDAIPTLEGRHLGGTRYTLVYPSLAFAATTDSMWYFECHPQGPGHTKYSMNMCFPRSTVERDDFDRMAANYFQRWETGIAEDNVVMEAQQRGLSSPLSRPGRLSHLEPVVGLFAQWVVNNVVLT